MSEFVYNLVSLYKNNLCTQFSTFCSSTSTCWYVWFVEHRFVQANALHTIIKAINKMTMKLTKANVAIVWTSSKVDALNGYTTLYYMTKRCMVRTQQYKGYMVRTQLYKGYMIRTQQYKGYMVRTQRYKGYMVRTQQYKGYKEDASRWTQLWSMYAEP